MHSLSSLHRYTLHVSPCPTSQARFMHMRINFLRCGAALMAPAMHPALQSGTLIGCNTWCFWTVCTGRTPGGMHGIKDRGKRAAAAAPGCVAGATQAAVSRPAPRSWRLRLVSHSRVSVCPEPGYSRADCSGRPSRRPARKLGPLSPCLARACTGSKGSRSGRSHPRMESPRGGGCGSQPSPPPRRKSEQSDLAAASLHPEHQHPGRLVAGKPWQGLNQHTNVQ